MLEVDHGSWFSQSSFDKRLEWTGLRLSRNVVFLPLFALCVLPADKPEIFDGIGLLLQLTSGSDTIKSRAVYLQCVYRKQQWQF